MNHTGNLSHRQSTLIEANIRWLRQAQHLLEGISDSLYTDSPESIAPHRVGGHMRHILDFYQCFLSGLEGGHIDYDARERDILIETNRNAACARIAEIVEDLETLLDLRGDRILWIRTEDCEAQGVADQFLTSSIGRELQVLSSHTIHHFALIAMTLRAQGCEVDRSFGMAPSTVRYQASRDQRVESREAA